MTLPVPEKCSCDALHVEADWHRQGCVYGHTHAPVAPVGNRELRLPPSPLELEEIKSTEYARGRADGIREAAALCSSYPFPRNRILALLNAQPYPPAALKEGKP